MEERLVNLGVLLAYWKQFLSSHLPSLFSEAGALLMDMALTPLLRFSC